MEPRLEPIILSFTSTSSVQIRLTFLLITPHFPLGFSIFNDHAPSRFFPMYNAIACIQLARDSFSREPAFPQN